MTDDVFGGEGRPAVSWKDVQIGEQIVLHVDEPASLVQSKDFDTGEPAFWPANADGTRNPKMSAVINVTHNGEEKSLWAAKPSSLFAAIRDAQKAAGALVAKGGVLTVWITERKPNARNPKLNAQNIFAASYKPGNAFADEPAQQAPAAPAQPAVSAPAAPPASAPSGDAVTALKAKLSNMRKVGLSDAQIADSAPNLGITAIDGSPLTADMVAAILVV